jgi:hypothetical protein
LNSNYPEQSLETTGARFLQYQLVASDLDGAIRPTEEFIASMSAGRNKTNGSRYENPRSDQTSFMFNVQLERSNAGFCYDGIDTDGQNVTITLKGGPIYSGINDTYFCVALKDGATGTSTNDYTHPPNPQMWICSETCWKLSTNGMTYQPYENPPNIQVIDSLR